MSETFLGLKNRVKTRLIDAPTAVQNEVGQFVNLAIRDAQDLMNFKIMEAEATVTTSSTQRVVTTFAPSTGFKETRGKPYLVDNNGGRTPLYWLPDREDAAKVFPAPQVTPSDITTVWGQPLALLLTASTDLTDVQGTKQVECYPIPNNSGPFSGNYRIVIPYWRYLPDLVADGDANWFTVYGEMYIIAQATGHGFLSDWDEQRAATWFQIAGTYGAKLKRKNTTEILQGAGALIPRADAGAERDQWRRS